MVLLVGLQMLGELGDAAGEDRDLDLRGAGIGLGPAIVGDQLGLVLFRQRHVRRSVPPGTIGTSGSLEYGVSGRLDERGQDPCPDVAVGRDADLRDPGAGALYGESSAT